MFNEYADFEISISPLSESRYTVAVSGPGGDASGALVLPTDNPAYQALAARLAQLDTDESALVELGQILFQALFQGAIRDVYARSQGLLTADQGLRLRMHIAPSEVAVIGLPWEFLYDPDQGPLALLDAPIVRYLPQPARIPTLHTSLPLKVLLTGAQTPPQAAVERELREVSAALAQLGTHVQITVEPHLTPQKLQGLLRQGFHVWHFIGHGGFAKDGVTGQLYFEDATGETETVSALQLGILLNRSGVRLVVLDACNGAKLSTDPFRSIAPALVHAQIPAVVAMQFTVSEEATRAFAGEFYQALAEGFPIDACVTEGRKAVMNASGLGHADWGIPVVYTRAHDGRLFQLPGGDQGPAADDRPTVPATSAAPLPAQPQPETAPKAPTPAPGPIPASMRAGAELHELASNLPAQSTALIGREQDVTTAQTLLLRPEVRLMTLTGTAGVGKTRLAIEIAQQLLDVCTDGVFFIDLSVISDPALVLREITQTLRLREQGEQTQRAILEEYLGKRNMLLLLDNFEQVLPAGPAIVELLESAPELQVIVTSRAALRVSGEYEFPVLPLGLPDLRRLPPLKELAASPAIALFVERARAVKPDFALTEANAARVAEICARLDGLPLAIELAAARRKVLNTEALLARLAHRFELLTGGARDLSARQQTLRGAIDWSYQLLAPGEQRLLAHLAVFVGGFTVEAAEAVMRAEGQGPSAEGATSVLSPQPSVLDTLQSLVDNSLLQQTDMSDGDARFAMLETIREYALERLVDSGERASLRQQHAGYYLALAEQAEAELDRPQQDVWLERLDQEHDNLLAALDWAWEQSQAEVALRMCEVLAPFWNTRGYLSEGRRWIDQILSLEAQPGGQAAGPDLGPTIAHVHAGAGKLALTQGDYAAAREHYDAALARFQQLGDTRGTAIALNGLAGLEGRLGNYQQAQAHFNAALVQFQQLGDTLNAARLLSNRGLFALLQDDNIQAQVYLEESLALRQELGDTIGMIWSIANLGEVAYRCGDTTQAIARYTRSLALCQKLGAKEGMAVCLEGLAQVGAAGGQPLPAAELWGAAEALRESIGAAHQQVWRGRYERAVADARDNAGQVDFEAAWARGRDLPVEQAAAAALAMATEEA